MRLGDTPVQQVESAQILLQKRTGQGGYPAHACEYILVMYLLDDDIH